tara:strand:- start:37 stop:759 length:723 start_codon:yes stop_codon:yes gene_type:complete
MTDLPVDPNIALTQWLDLVLQIQKLGGTVKTIKPTSNLPDMVFTANCGTVNKNTVVLSNMKHVERQGEKKHFSAWFKHNGYDVVELIPGAIFEGCGDAVVIGDNLIGGYGFRSNLLGLEIAAASFGLNLISLKLKDPRFYHLDTCFCKISNTHAIYFPGAFEDGEINKLKNIINLIPVSEKDARSFMCNSMLVNDTLLIPAMDTEIESILKAQHGIKTRYVGVEEFLKSGGSIQCLCLKL